MADVVPRRSVTVLLATSNSHKLDEIRAVFATCRGGGDVAVGLVGLKDLGRPIPEPVEDQDTFEGNAVLKARYYAGEAGMLCLADDSGLEVDALGGEPGVRSARYAGLTGGREVVDPANNRALLARMAGVPVEERTGRFVCAMALVDPAADQPLAVLRGTVEGRILLPDEAADARQPERGRGHNGFGYDPLFLIDQLGRTTAELDPDHKNRVSHRGQAARLMWQRIQDVFGAAGSAT